MENVTKEEIENLTTYEDGYDFMIDRELPIDGINNLNDVKEFLTCKYLNDYNDCTDIDPDYEEYLKDFEIMRKSLIRLEEKLENFLRSPQFKQELEQHLESSLNCELYLTKLRTFRENLIKYECPIMVIGESKAGKSSFINLFLGDIVLPVDNLTCTKILCHLKYGLEKKVVFSQSKSYSTMFGESKKHDDIEIKLKMISEDKKRELYGRISMNKGHHQFYDQAFFYWPLGFLKGHTIMVDSPGLCDSDELNEKTLECFDNKAAAYIFVFNATRENRWVDDFVRKAYKKLSSPDKMTKEIEKVIFVINQWDLITDLHPDEEDEKRESVLDKLKHLWPGLDTRDKVFFISSKKTLDWIKQKAVPENFQRLNNSLQKLIKKAHKSTTDANYGLIKKITEKMDKLVLERIKWTHDRHFNQRNFEQETRVLIRKLKDTREMAVQIAQELYNETEINFYEAAKNFLLYLESDEVRSELLDLSKVKLHSYNSIHIITPLIKKIIRYRMERAIISWDKESKCLSNLYVIFNHSLKCKLNSLGDALTAIDTGLKRDFMDFSNDDREAEILNQGGMEVISPFEKAVLITSSFVLFPVMAVGAMVAAPNFIISLVKDKFDERALLEDFRSNPFVYATNKFQTYLDELKPKDIIETFFVHMMDQFNLAAESIPERINALILTEKRKLKGFFEESRSTDQLLVVYRPLQTVVNHLSGERHLIDFYHQPDDEFESECFIKYPLPEENLILTTSYAKYYSSPMPDELYRVLKQPLTNENAKEQYEELRVFKLLLKFIAHKENILEWKSYKRIKDCRVMVHIMEKFDMSLRQYLEENPDYIPAKQDDLEKKRKAFDFCLEIAGQTAQILFNVNITYGLVHKDLRSENILIKIDDDNHVTLKLCDFCSIKQIDDTIMENPQAMQFLPPEMHYHLGAFDKAEVYCFGAFLWEIYTMGTLTDEQRNIGGSLMNDPEVSRFNLNDLLAPPKWKKLIESCLYVNPIKRPKMKDCFESIRQLKDELSQDNWRQMFQESDETKVIVLEKDFKRRLSLD